LLASRSLERRVPLRGKLNSQLASCCIARLLVLATEDRQKPIITYIDSPTGEASGALSVISTMNGIQSPVVTFSRGVIGGAAAVVAAHGLKGFRTAHPNAEFSLKLGAGPEIDGNTQPQESYVKMLTQLLAKDTGRPEEEVFGWLTHGIQFSAQEAVRHGLIDSVATEPVLPKPA
jgi:ATP-dependent Clp endopeptidase proteolytic subunit ClpP